jgi:hypothetical protein
MLAKVLIIETLLILLIEKVFNALSKKNDNYNLELIFFSEHS